MSDSPTKPRTNWGALLLVLGVLIIVFIGWPFVTGERTVRNGITFIVGVVAAVVGLVMTVRHHSQQAKNGDAPSR